MLDIDAGVKELDLAFPGTSQKTDKLISFQNRLGKQIALEKKRTVAFFVWIQKFDDGIPGIKVRNQKNPGLPYLPAQSRNSNLKGIAPNLAMGKKAWYLEVQDLSALKALIEWFSRA